MKGSVVSISPDAFEQPSVYYNIESDNPAIAKDLEKFLYIKEKSPTVFKVRIHSISHPTIHLSIYYFSTKQDILCFIFRAVLFGRKYGIVCLQQTH